MMNAWIMAARNGSGRFEEKRVMVRVRGEEEGD